MAKEKTVSIRVSVADYDFVVKMGGHFSDIFEMGLEKWAEKYPDFLQEKINHYKDMYVHCTTLMGEVYKGVVQRTTELDGLYRLYVSQGRSIQNPVHEDRYWVNQRLQKIGNGSRISVMQFFEYCRKRYDDEKQKRLEVEE